MKKFKIMKKNLKLLNKINLKKIHKIGLKTLLGFILMASVNIGETKENSLNAFQMRSNQYISLYGKEATEKLKKYEPIFKKEEDWFVLKNPLPNLSNYADLIVWQVYNCEDCAKLDSALNVFNYRKQYDSTYKTSSEIIINKFPIVRLNNSENLFKDSVLFNALNNMISEKDFNNINNLLLKDSAAKKVDITNKDSLFSWAKKNNINEKQLEKELSNYSNYNKSYAIGKLFEKQPVKDIPLVIFNGKYVIPSTTINKFNESKLIDLMEYLSILSILDYYGQIK